MCLQVLQNHNQFEKQRGRMNNSHFFLPQILALIFRFLSDCESVAARIKIIENILDLLDTNLSNIEALLVKILLFVLVPRKLFNDTFL